MALDNGNTSLKYAAWLSPILLSILLIGSIIFCRERMLFIYAPHILFRIINDRHFWIEQHRYGSFISQLLPLIGAQLHLPLRWLMLLYSAGFYLFYLVVCLLLVRLQQYGLAVLMGLYFTVMVSATYFWPNNEVHQGIAWLLLAFGLNACMAGGMRNSYLRIALFTAIFFLAIWTHPLVIPAALYLWVFFLVSNWQAKDNKQVLWLSTGILLLLCTAKVYTGMHDWYDGGKIDLVTHVDLHKLKDLPHAPQLHYFVRNCLHRYWLFSLLTISGLLALLFQRRYILFILTIAAGCGYVVLVCITFWQQGPLWYMESEYMPLVLIGCAPFVYYLLPKIKPPYALALLAAVYILRLACIYYVAAPFTNRLILKGAINNEMREKHLTKVIINPPPATGKMADFLDIFLIATWGAPVESLCISALNGEHPQRTFILMKPGEIKPADTTARNIFLGCFERRNAVQLDPRYFQIDTTTTYKVMSYEEVMR